MHISNLALANSIQIIPECSLLRKNCIAQHEGRIKLRQNKLCIILGSFIHAFFFHRWRPRFWILQAFSLGLWFLDCYFFYSSIKVKNNNDTEDSRIRSLKGERVDHESNITCNWVVFFRENLLFLFTQVLISTLERKVDSSCSSLRPTISFL